jgi:poly-beta-1,6-N-acetyl-D-glucosamine synthase
MIIHEHPLLFILLIIFGISALVQLFYYLYFYLAPARFRQSNTADPGFPVSVIICARNEEENLRNFLPSVLEQDYPDYEVIVVNDCSEDESYDVLGGFIKKYHNLKVSNISRDPKFTHSKRFAEFIGIKAAKNEILLFTDADCRPVGKDWISSMVCHFDGNTDFVLGYGGYLKKKGLLNKYIRYDSMAIAMQYLGMAIRGIPYMGVGRNLAYRRSLFFSKKGFANFNHMVSGDDDLFVNSNASEKNTAVEFRKEAHTRSVPAGTVDQFYKQKCRHMTTARHYKFNDKIVLFIEPASRTLFYVLLIILLSNLYMLPALAAAFFVRLIVNIIVFTLTQQRLDERGLLPWALIFDVISPFINSAIYAGNFRQTPGKNVWK